MKQKQQQTAHLGERLNRRTLLKAGLGTLVVGVGAGTWIGSRSFNSLASSPPPPPPLAPQPSDTVVIQWNKVSLQAIANTGSGPTIGARALAIIHTSMFDAWTPFDPIAVATRPNGITKYRGSATLKDINTAISYAAYFAFLDLFPSQASMATALMQTLSLNPMNTSTDTSTPTGIGNVAARAVVTYRHSDGSNQLNGYADTTGYTPVNTPSTIIDPNRWQPLSLPNGTVQKFLTPHWGTVTPFALTSGSQFRPAGPAVTTQTQYQTQASTVLQLSAALNDTSKSIAEYWSDGPHTATPPGHWDLFGQLVAAQFVSQSQRHNTTQDIALFFTLTNALFDASIACWDCKRAFDSARPITAIHYLYNGKPITAWAGPGKGTQSFDGGSWNSYLQTPPFAEYVSGHSTFSATAASILSNATGADTFGYSYTVPASSSLVEPGITPSSPVLLSWPTFSGAAVQAGMSRQYGGIHFAQADVDGRALGNKVGPQANTLALAYINGRIHHP